MNSFILRKMGSPRNRSRSSAFYEEDRNWQCGYRAIKLLRFIRSYYMGEGIAWKVYE